MKTGSPLEPRSVNVGAVAVDDDDAIRASLAHVLHSSHFAHAPRLSRFLAYIVEESLAGRGDAIKEYALAADVFGRGDDYDSSTDAIVRVEAGRLRQKLHAYYADEGRDALVEIELPKGGYVPAFRARAVAAAPPPPEQPARSSRTSSVWYAVVTVIAVVVVGSVAMLRSRPSVDAAVRVPGPSFSADEQATDAFLKGQYLRNQMTTGAIREAVGWFERAVARDQAFAGAWAALGEARATLVFHDAAPAGTTLDHARADIERALSLSSSLGEARGTLARIHLTRDFDWARAEPEFRRALTDAPDNARLHQWFAFALASRGRFADALAMSHRATQLNPAAYVGTTDRAMLLFFARRFSEALDDARQAHAVNPRMAIAQVVEGMCLVATGRYDEGIDEYLQVIDADVIFTGINAKLAHAYGLSGRRREALAHAEMASRDYAPRPVPAIDRALVQIGLGDLDGAMASLEDGFARRDGDALFFDVNPLLDPLRGSPRFADLRRRAGM